MIDTHAHLTDPLFQDDLSQVLQRASQNGVNTIICVSEDAADAESVIQLHAQHGRLVRPAVGIHPERANKLTLAEVRAELERLEAVLYSHRSEIVAVGEAGLDYAPHVLQQSAEPGGGKEVQAEAFRAQVALAQRLDLPLSVHSRAAGHHALGMLGGARACMHAFDGRPVYAERALDQARDGVLYFSVAPSVARDDGLRKLVKRLPLERLLLESDSPALPAEKGARNEPAEIARSLHMIAALKTCSVEHAREVLERNTHALFNKLGSENS